MGKTDNIVIGISHREEKKSNINHIYKKKKKL